MNITSELIEQYNNTALIVFLNGKWDYIESVNFSGHVITAWNPLGVKDTLKQNQLANINLENELRCRNVYFYPCVGCNLEQTWFEIGFAIEGLSDAQAREIGRKFEQLAIFQVVNSFKSLIDCN